MVVKILNENYSQYIELLGTAHFTKRSLDEAYDAVRKLNPTDLAIELDVQRFHLLNNRCASCTSRRTCVGRCEFLGATDALGNMNANIWLIDISEKEMLTRIRGLKPPSPSWFSFVQFPFYNCYYNDEIWLWENGYKDEVIRRNKKRLEYLRLRAPNIWRVLIDERNVLMAARLAWVVTQRLDRGEEAKILALMGAAHISGVKKLLCYPLLIREELRKFGLKFTEPTLIRRVCVN